MLPKGGNGEIAPRISSHTAGTPLRSSRDPAAKQARRPCGQLPQVRATENPEGPFDIYPKDLVFRYRCGFDPRSPGPDPMRDSLLQQSFGIGRFGTATGNCRTGPPDRLSAAARKKQQEATNERENKQQRQEHPDASEANIQDERPCRKTRPTRII